MPCRRSTAISRPPWPPTTRRRAGAPAAGLRLLDRGDRDGNPHVTPAVTLEALDLMRDRCLAFLERRLEVLAERLSYSERVTGRRRHRPDAGAWRRALPRADRADARAQRRGALPARVHLRRCARARRAPQPAGAYAGPEELLGDLRAAAHALSQGPGAAAAAGDLHDVIRQVEVFGFHFARLDVRENAKVHRGALDEIFAELDVCRATPSCPSPSAARCCAG